MASMSKWGRYNPEKLHQRLKAGVPTVGKASNQ